MGRSMSDIQTRTQISSGGVAFRWVGDRIEIALISVGENRRWQLPKGLVNRGESLEETALREVREEAGIHTDLIRPVDKIEYWYYSSAGKSKRIRYHKFVHFFLLRWISGDVRDHDQEVNEACWVEIEQAAGKLAFESEAKVARRAGELIRELGREG